jgi:hypothetical protein
MYFDDYSLTLRGARASILLDQRLSPDLSRGRGKSIGGDLDVDDKGSEQNVEPL